MRTQAPADESILETARTDPESVDIDTVVGLLDAERGTVRDLALHTLLFVAVDDPDRVAAIGDRVVERLDDEFPVAGSKAAGVLAKISETHPDAVRPAVPALVEKLGEQPPRTGHRAMRALCPFLRDDPTVFVPEADALVDVLIGLPEVWAPTPSELRDLPEGRREATRNLLSSRQSEIAQDVARTNGIRAFAAHTLVEVSKLQPGAVTGRLDELSPALSNEPALARAATLDVIANVAKTDPPATAPAIEAVIERLEDDTEFVRAHAVRTLGFAEASEAIEPLRSLAERADDDALGELASQTVAWLEDESVSTS